ncbi:hypothetical protein FOZ62_031554 [Perkinsus olseni]|uniref:Transmembrane protein 65 n=1 Tax=Perkinsus olseni TaxID=32597 RepID=A0A7J6SCS6_PEROL|nr:hypothetical protein FOZ62_031554 [Perkinsus olseni]
MSNDRIRRRVSESLLAKIEDQLGKGRSSSLGSGERVAMSIGMSGPKVDERENVLSAVGGATSGGKAEAPTEVGHDATEAATGETGVIERAGATNNEHSRSPLQDEVSSTAQKPHRLPAAAPTAENGRGAGAGEGLRTEAGLAFARRPSLLAFARQEALVAGRAVHVPGRGSSLTIDQDDLTRRIKQAVSMGYGIRRLQEVLQDSTVNSSTKAMMERGWRKLRESDSKLLQWFDARARGCHHLRCALLIVVKSRLTAAMTRLQLLMEHTPTQDTYHHVQQIPKLHHLFSAMYEAEVAVGVARLHALLEKALHRHLRAAITVLSSSHGYKGDENSNNPRLSVAASVVIGSTSHAVDGSPISRTACLDNCTAAKVRHFCGTTLGANAQPPPPPQSTSHGLDNPAKVDDITEFLALARDDLNMVAKDLADSNTIDNNALQWMRNYRVTSLSDTPEKANYILKWTFICSAIPFIGFGFLDNALMLIFGEQIDNSLCVVMGFSTLAAAALGNAFSDLAGVFAGSHIEHQAEL